MADRTMLLFGTDEPGPEERRLEAGALSVLYAGGALRSIAVQGVEVIRGLYFLIRDRNWATPVPEVRDLRIDETAEGFTLSFAAHCVTPADNQTIVWKARIEGSAREGLSFAVEATPDADLSTQRTGFVILHPLARCAGTAAVIEHTDGRVVASRFPDLVDPLCAFLDVQAMSYEPVPGLRVTCRMEGGGWETEDHRNWLDASFKTYFRSLALPHPYTIEAGETVRQRVTVRFEPDIADLPAEKETDEIVVTVGDRTGAAMPAIGLSAMVEDLDGGIEEAPLLRDLGLHELSVRVCSDTPDLPGVLRKAALLARALDATTALDIVVSARSEAACELDLVAVAAASAGLRPDRVMVSPEIDLASYPPSVDRPSSPPLRPLYAAARSAFPGVPLGGGMFSFFTELNRRRPPVELLDYVQHASAADVHAADDRSVMETLESLPHVFRTARSFIGDAAYHVGPAGIGMPFNPYGEATTPNPDRRRTTMTTDDPRHKALFGATFTAGYLARAAQGGLTRVTLGAVAGPMGVTRDGAPTPAGHVLGRFARLTGDAVLQTASSKPQEVLAIAAEGATGRLLCLANLTDAARTVRLAGLRARELRMIDVASQGRIGERTPPGDGTLELDAYAVALVSW